MDQVLGRVTLVTGPEEFQGERAISRLRASVRKVDSEAEFSETMADSLTMSALGELVAPSLFSATRCVVVRQLENLPDESVAGIVDYAASPAEDVALVLVHSGGAKGSGLLTKLRKLSEVAEIKSEKVTPRDLPRFVSEELRSHKTKIAPEAAALLVQAVGQDLRSLASAADQLAGDAEGEMVTEELVGKYFGGRAEAKSFAVADKAIEGDAAGALEELRWALERGTAPVLITSALSTGLRSLARFLSAPRGMRNAELTKLVGVPPWKLDVLRRQSRGWEPDGVGSAIQAVAEADADVKGQASDAPYALERMVITVARARASRR